MAMELQTTFSAFVAVAQFSGSRSHHMIRQNAVRSCITTLTNLGQLINSNPAPSVAPRSYYQFHPSPSYPSVGLPPSIPQPHLQTSARKRPATETPVPRTAPANGSRSLGPRANGLRPTDNRRNEVRAIGFIKYSCEHRDVMRLCPLPRGLQQQFCYAYASVGMCCREPDNCLNPHLETFSQLTIPADVKLLKQWRDANPTLVTLINADQ
jgi:hypothetical protein